MTRKTLTSLAIAAALVVASPLSAQSGAAAGKVARIKVHSPAIEGNLQGNAADRDVLVYLPPSYAASRNRRYPVVYQLHGWLPGGEQWAGMIDFEAGTYRALTSGAAKEMIVVVPDSLTIHGGSMYSTSAKPPLYFDFPVEYGEVRPLLLAKWNANLPLTMIDQYVPNLRTFTAIASRSGRRTG